MDGGRRNERTLLKIAALLVSLALLAERAAGRSLPVRFLVFAILRRAEAIAKSFVAREAGVEGMDWPAPGDAAAIRNQPLEGAWLALSFRMLAAALCDLVEAAAGSAAIGSTVALAAVRDTLAGGAPRAPVLLLFFPAARRPHDTS